MVQPATREETLERISIMPAQGSVSARFNGAVIAESDRALRLEEQGHAPVLYIPKEDVQMSMLEENDKHTTCPYKGEARYWSIAADGGRAENAVWAYDQPQDGVEEIAGYVAFDPSMVKMES